TLSCSGGSASRLHSANIFPPTLNTDTSSPNGNSSLAPGNPRHRSLSHCAVNSCSAMMLPIPPASSASLFAHQYEHRDFCVVDSGFVVDLGDYSAPDQPHNPNRPRSFAGSSP